MRRWGSTHDAAEALSVSRGRWPHLPRAGVVGSPRERRLMRVRDLLLHAEALSVSLSTDRAYRYAVVDAPLTRRRLPVVGQQVGWPIAPREC